jgi:hypothetical protein
VTVREVSSEDYVQKDAEATEPQDDKQQGERPPEPRNVTVTPSPVGAGAGVAR